MILCGERTYVIPVKVLESREGPCLLVSRGNDGGATAWGMSSPIQGSRVFIEPSPVLARITKVATLNTEKSGRRTNNGTRTEDGKAFRFRVSRTSIPGRDLFHIRSTLRDLYKDLRITEPIGSSDIFASQIVFQGQFIGISRNFWKYRT